MALNNRGLGRGIQALFNGNGEGAGEHYDQDSPLNVVPIAAIETNPVQPREFFADDKLDELAASIKAHGILQPLLVRPLEDGKYQLIAGERRLRAAGRAGLYEVPVIARDLDDREALIVTLLENLQREDLNPIEEAKGLEALRAATDASVEQIAETLGQGRSTIAHALRLLKLDPVLQEDVAERRITPSHAKSLGQLPVGEVLMTARERVLEHDLTSRETEELVSFWNSHGHFSWEDNVPGVVSQIKKRTRKFVDPSISRLANYIGATLNCRAKINGTPEKGRISISYDTNTQLFELLDRLGLQMETREGGDAAE